jgi:DNA-binding response OmpR family regulator
MSQLVLVAEQDRSVLSFFRSALSGDGLQIIAALGRPDALARAVAWTPAAAVLGTGFGTETLDLVGDLRRECGLRVLIVARPGEETLVTTALERGAVGFIVHPLQRAELSTRVRELLSARAVSDGHYVTAGPVTLDLSRRSLVRPGSRPSLTPCEFEILRWFLTPPGRTFTRRQLLATDRAAFPPRAHASLVDRQVASLRRKLGEAGDLIESMGQVGWRFAVQRAGPLEVEFSNSH